MLIASGKEFRIQQDKLLNVLRVEWVGGKNMRNFRGAFDQLLRLTENFLVSRLVLDINTLPDVSVYDQLWLSTHFMPELVRLPLAQVVVVLPNERVYNHQVMESLLMDTYTFKRVDIQFFTQAEPAMQWITNNSPRLALLLAEWQQASGEGPSQVAEPRARYRAS